MRKIVAFCDASYDRKSGAGGVGVYYQSAPDDDASLSLAVSGMHDCNYGEVFALWLVLCSVGQTMSPEEIKTFGLVIYLDSDHALALFNGEGEVKEGREFEAEMIKSARLYASKLSGLEIVCVKSHRGFSPLGMANEHCDRLAKKAMRLMRDTSIEVKPIKDIFKDKGGELES
tara:strand:- start:3232 stop:3750 length:519 start_codon:yes stop_codon:yes gene_type:complete